MLSLCSKLYAFDVRAYGRTLKSVDSRIEEASKDVVELSALAAEFNEANDRFSANLISKFENAHNFVGAEVVSIGKLLVINQKICRAFLDKSEHDSDALTRMAAKVVLLHQAQTFFAEFYHPNRQLRKMIKAALKSIVQEDGREHKWRDEVEAIRAIALDENFYVSLNHLPVGDETLLKLINENTIPREEYNFSNHGFVDSFFGAINGTMGYTNATLTNLTGNKRLRNGHLYKNEKIKNLLNNVLHPMDVMMLSSPFAFAGLGVPGHFDHGAIYLGTKEQLTALGLWNDPSILPYQKEIEKGNVILDNTRTGVHLNNFETFLNTDEILVMRRDGELDDLDRVSAQLKIGTEQIGKKYNFTFDVLKLNKLLFSELIYFIYDTDEFPTRYRLKHLTMYPSDIVDILFQKDTAFQMVIDVEGNSKKDLVMYDLETVKKRNQKAF